MENNFVILKRKNVFYIALYIALILFLLVDLGYTFRQFYLTPLDGDMAGGIVPAEDVKPILSHPFGVASLTSEASYPNPNKFFSHYLFYHYFNQVPQWLQHVVSPIDSVYLACAIAKLLMQILLLWIMSIFITGCLNPFRFNNLVVITLFSTLLQTYGYHNYIGIIDVAVTYSFFYALPILFLAIYFIPYWLYSQHGRSLPLWLYWVWLLWIPIVTLSGPLNPGIALIISMLYGVYVLIHKQRLGLIQWITFAPLVLFSLYSLFVGTFNVLSQNPELDLWARYLVLPQGVFKLLSGKLAWMLILLVVIINSLLILRFLPTQWPCIKKELLYVLAFTLFYNLLLPLGGYRDYRPYIVRYDTVIPVTLAFFYLLVKTSLFLLLYLKNKILLPISLYIVLIAFIFENADNMKFTTNECERNSISIIENSENPIVTIPQDCKVATWDLIVNPNDSQLTCDMLQKLNVLSSHKQFINQ